VSSVDEELADASSSPQLSDDLFESSQLELELELELLVLSLTLEHLG